MSEVADGPRRYEPVSDAFVLAAIDRAQRHGARGSWSEHGVSWPSILNHLGFVHNSWTTRNLSPQVDALIADGLVTKEKAHSRLWWKLTDAGRKRVARARRAGEADLPTSPQRLVWRRNRTVAAEEIDRIRAGVGSALDYACRLLEEGKSDSTVWQAIGERLALECDRLAGATFCLNEWPEPDDENPDVDGRSALNVAARVATRGLHRRGGVE